MKDFILKLPLFLTFLFSHSSFSLSITKTSTEDGFNIRMIHTIGKLSAIKGNEGARVEIETNNLFIKTTLENDLDDLINFFRDPENVLMDGTGKPLTEKDLRDYYKNIWLPDWKKGSFKGALTLFLKIEDASEIIGQVAITSEDTGVGNLGLLIDKKYWKQGYGREVCDVISDLLAPLLIFLKEDFEGKPLEKMFFTTSIDNEAVVRLADKYGGAIFVDLNPIEKDTVKTIEPNLCNIKQWKEYEVSDVVKSISFIANLLIENKIACKNLEKNELFSIWATKVSHINLDFTESREELLHQFCNILSDELTIWRCCTKDSRIRSVLIQSCFDGTLIRPPKYCFQVFSNPEKLKRANKVLY